MKLETREERSARWAGDRRFLQVLKQIAISGLRVDIYALDENGVRHCLNPANAHPVCGRKLPDDAKVEFYKHTTCVRCVWLV